VDELIMSLHYSGGYLEVLFVPIPMGRVVEYITGDAPVIGRVTEDRFVIIAASTE